MQSYQESRTIILVNIQALLYNGINPRFKKIIFR